MEILALLFVAVLAWLVFSFIFALPVMWLWNWLLPTLFSLPEITWTQAWGLMFLCALLFKSSHVSTKSK